MKFAILAGGQGTRLSELTRTVNKPLLEVGRIPLVLHVAVRFFLAGATTVSLLVGYESERFLTSFGEVRIKLLKSGKTPSVIRRMLESVQFEFLDAGAAADTYERILGICNSGPVMVTYGDTLMDINVNKVIDFWNARDNTCALTCVVRPPKRFSSVKWDRTSNKALSFEEKKGVETNYVGCGYVILPPEVSCSVAENATSLEIDVLPRLARNGQLLVYEHMGLWLPVDYLSDLQDAEILWNGAPQSGAPWIN
ncbi:sugar phosphate nucleotidyltransferase [Luminiphilus sp.]|nr:sugar phosphate nucleotidyltransferase [Luminiphilus sp.]